MDTDDRKKKTAIREWIIFALCLGLGAHITLGFVMHDVKAWPPQTYGVYGLLISFALYVVVQLIRSIWWMIRGDNVANESLE